MDVARLSLLAASVAGFAIPVADAQDNEEIAAHASASRGAPKPWKFVRGLGRVLDLSRPPVIIDEPGLYAVQQNWLFPQATTAAVPELIQITADKVTLDLHGFTIAAESRIAPPLVALFVITGDSVEIRNGDIEACCEAATAVDSTGAGTSLHHLGVYSHEGMRFGRLATFTDSEIGARDGIRFEDHSRLQRNTIDCNFICATLSGDRNEVTDNRMSPFNRAGVRILGNENIVANNIIDASEVLELTSGFEVAGDHNVVRNNTVFVSTTVSSVLQISGTANTLDGNIGAPPSSTERAAVGMEFTADGNFYGDNRMAARVPFALGGTVQIDWGDNVGY